VSNSPPLKRLKTNSRFIQPHQNYPNSITPNEEPTFSTPSTLNDRLLRDFGAVQHVLPYTSREHVPVVRLNCSQMGLKRGRKVSQAEREKNVVPLNLLKFLVPRNFKVLEHLRNNITHPCVCL
jgi:hypothetical protein